MRVGMTIWEGRISPLFDTARVLLLTTVNDGQERDGRFQVALPEDAWEKVVRLQDLEVEMLVCGAISGPLLRDMSARKILVKPFVAATVEDVIQVVMSGESPELTLPMPGCGGRHCRRQRCGQGRKPGRHAHCTQRKEA